jgi:hypothetical protein
MESYVPDETQTGAETLLRRFGWVLTFLAVVVALFTIGAVVSMPGPVAPVDPGSVVQPVAPQWSFEDPAAPAGGVR